MKINRRLLYIMSLITLFGFPLLGIAWLMLFGENFNIAELFTSGSPVSEQLLRGTIFGLTGAAVALWLINLNILEKITSYFLSIFSEVKLKWYDIIFFSFCAGLGEEIFFRGAMQHFWGIWITAFFFIAIHGYLSLTNLNINLYGLMMVVIVAGFGYLCNIYGIWAAVSAHFIFDVVMFLYIGKKTVSSNEGRITQ